MLRRAGLFRAVSAPGSGYPSLKSQNIRQVRGWPDTSLAASRRLIHRPLGRWFSVVVIEYDG
ncbi:hypothetical protein A5647_07835 [Mycobacterium sp. 1100029.7]|nr:hypothetical protein A5647_07835 [Mycobacterium sp. 1100029.7]